MTKIIKVDDDVHKYLKTMAASSGFASINECLKFIIKNLKKKEPEITPIRTRHGGVPL